MIAHQQTFLDSPEAHESTEVRIWLEECAATIDEELEGTQKAKEGLLMQAVLETSLDLET